jgi:hypothetical protein
MRHALNRITALVVVIIIAAGVSPALAQAPAPPAAKPKLVAPVKGIAVIEVLKPDVKVKGNEVVTVIQIRNASYAPIAGLRVDEFWYDKAGNLLPGDSKRVPKPVQVGEVVTVELHTPKDPKMNRNAYQFTHANGKVRADTVKSFK